ncbi:MAG: hypothetical protein QOF78_4080 [Phycisphaerales bacterium]|jgi:hypothetical protein|nr:hypothetical protein [Phycisphaerales bacterium]
MKTVGSALFSGLLADSGALLLSEYAASLAGWRELMQVLGELYLHSYPELRKVRGTDLLRIEVVAEKPGSYETVLVFMFGAIAGGILGNRADAATLWTFSKLTAWYKRVIGGFVQVKSQTTDITVIAAALASMAVDAEVLLDTAQTSEVDTPLFDAPTTDEQNSEEEYAAPHQKVDKARALAEIIDQALQRATQPLVQSCHRITVAEAGKRPLLEIGPAERAVIVASLTLPPPTRDWRQGRVKFERINRRTGKALFNFENDDPSSGAHYSHIVDPSVQKPHNVYTEAFNDDLPLDVWVRQASPEKGKLHFQWEIHANNPDQGTLFNLPPEG